MRPHITVNICPVCDEPVLPGEGWKLVNAPEHPGDIKPAVGHYKCPKKKTFTN